MKITTGFLALLLPLAALNVHAEPSSSVHVTVRYHHHHREHNGGHDTHAKKADHKLFHISGDKASFDKLLSPAVQKKLGFDVWRIRRVGEDSLVADIAATADAIAKLTTPRHHAHDRHHSINKSLKLHVKQEANDEWVSLEERITQDRKEVQSCLYATKGYLSPFHQNTESTGKYTDNAFFDCFRPYDQVFEFFDAVAEANPEIVTKIHNVSTTYEGRTIPAYKIATNPAYSPRARSPQDKQTIYTQSLMHAREWQAGASHFYAMASLIDDLRSGNAETITLFDEYEWVFTPIVNIDGYKYSWDVDRYWRLNRHPSNGFDGVDLNRNFPPEEYWNLDPTDVNEETNPGKAPLSEPETRGIYDFVTNLPALSGVVDVHAYGGMVLRPFSDVQDEPEEPYVSAMQRLGDAVRDAMAPNKTTPSLYISQPSGELYPAYGCMDDGIYRAFDYTVPALTIEVEGDDFIAPQQTIRDVGQHMNQGLRRFAHEVTTYRGFIQKLQEQSGQ